MHEVPRPEPGQHPVARFRAPWKLKAESYVLFLKLGKLPTGTYSLNDHSWADEGMGSFMGGVGTVMIVRYSNTPVGPYDELLLIPGTFSVPQPSNGPPKIPKRAQRVSRIYVSQRTTAYNGRLNWNIPKRLARFEFSSSSSPTALTVQVFQPGTYQGDGIPPFFACTLTPWTWAPSVPVNTRYIPKTFFIAQPPILPTAGYQAAVEEALAAPIDPNDLDPQKELSICVCTSQWRAFSVAARVSRAKGCWVEVLPGKGKMDEGDERDKWFPTDLKTWRVGSWCEEVEWTIKEPMEWEL